VARAERRFDRRPAHVTNTGTTEAMVAEMPKKDEPMPGGGGMGGMGDMM
jgi:hypothetical protein